MSTKKLIAAIDGFKYSESTPKYAAFFAKSMHAHVVGLLMGDPAYTSYKIYDLVSEEGLSDKRLAKFEKKDKLLRDTAKNNLEETFRKARLECSIHDDKNYALQELVYESIYADIVVIDSKENLSHHNEKAPTRFIRDLLIDIQCPAVIVPQKYKTVEKVILLYDAEPSSVHAIKMFSYLLPELKKLPTEVISVNSPSGITHPSNNKLMKEFMKRHYPLAKYIIKKGNPEQEISEYLKQHDNALVVLGAYRRGAASRWFRESMADVLMRETKLPLFIAHNK